MEISVIIAVYDKYDYLECVLTSLEKQSYKNFEVVIAEDCEKEQMKLKVEEWKEKYTFLIKHVFQEDIGFRKNKILNEALKVSEGEYIVVLDGDCVVHKQFLKQYMKYFEQGYEVVFGRRCEMSEKISKKILKSKGEHKIKLWELIFPYSKAWTECVYLPFFKELKKRKLRLLGSNMGFTKEIIFRINGFNEDYIGAGIGEDTDLQWRFLAVNAKYIAVKNKMVEYHIYHGRENRQNSIEGEKILRETQDRNEWYTRNGIIKVGD